jgi:hypothetical protein
MEFSKARLDLQARRALPAHLAAVELLVVVVRPRCTQAVRLRRRSAQSDGIKLLLLLDTAVEDHADVSVNLRCERPHEHHVGIEEGDDRVGRYRRACIFEPVLHPPRLVIKVICTNTQHKF